ncbi:unnamed protein product [Chironomus riparius]|uniref:DUF4780 domain-containing protein n=1 Tax=Chironomus riparius TaxID=315576 RepID=A0A9N9S3K8_9DIPT|nr:unnamed protein product [Chironomus riparius]
MKRCHEIDKFSDQNDYISLNCNDEIPSFNLGFSFESAFMDSFTNLNDPYYPAFQSNQSFFEDIDSILSSLENENLEIGQENLSNNILQDSSTAASNLNPQSTENEIILAAYLMDNVLTKDDVEVLTNRILDLIDGFKDSEWRPKHLSSNSEGGCWISKWANIPSTEWFMKIMSETPILINNVDYRLNIVPNKSLPKYKADALIKGKIISDDKILARFAKQNKEIDLSTSRWTDLECIPAGINKYKLCLEIDLLSSKIIKANGSKLFFGMEAVKFNIHDKLEFAAMDIISMEQEQLNY